MSGSGRYASSSDFIRQSTIDPLEATQDLNSSFSVSRRFDWGSVALGATGRQSMANGGISYTHVGSSSVTNDLRFGFSRVGFAPVVDVAGIAESSAYQLADTATIALGEHLVQAGGEWYGFTRGLESDEFAAWWAEHGVAQFETRLRRFRHPAAGLLTFEYQQLAPVEWPGLRVVCQLAVPGDDSAERLAVRHYLV